MFRIGNATYQPHAALIMIAMAQIMLPTKTKTHQVSMFVHLVEVLILF